MITGYAKQDEFARVVANGLVLREGDQQLTDARQGLIRLLNGEVHISSDVVTENTRVVLSRMTLGGVPGHLCATVTAGDLYIRSIDGVSGGLQTLDTSYVYWITIDGAIA